MDNQNSILSKMTRKVPKKPHLPKTIILFEKKKKTGVGLSGLCVFHHVQSSEIIDSSKAKGRRV